MKNSKLSLLLALAMTFSVAAQSALPAWAAQSLSTQEEATSSQEETPAQDETTSSTEDVTSQEETVSPQEEVPAAEESVPPQQETPSEDEATPPQQDTLTEDTSTEDTPSQDTPSVTDPTVGGVEVNLSSALPMGQDVAFTLSVVGEGDSGRATGTLGANPDGGASSTLLQVEDLEAGDYQVMLTAPGFATYTQSLTVEAGVYSQLTVYTSTLSGFDAEGNHPGFLRLGDVNEDGVLDSTDVDLLIDALQTGSDETGNADLNRDGQWNLADLDMLAANLGENETQLANVLSTVQTRLAHTLTQTAAAEGTQVEGDLDALVSTGDTVTLTPAGSGEISQSNPVALDFNFATQPQMEGMTIAPADSNPITGGTILVTYEEDGVEKTLEANIVEEVSFFSGLISFFTSAPTVTRLSNGSLQVDFGKQVAVKKITLTITATQNKNLAEISKVEFLNDMENRIPAPEMDVPTGLTAEAGDKEFTLSWKAGVNLTGYEVEITGPVKGGGTVTTTIRTTANTLLVTQLDGKKLINGRDYTVRVQGLNGKWSSGYSEPITVSPVVTKLPPKPDNLDASAGYQTITLSWKDMDDTDSYTVYYRVKGESEWRTAASGITGTQYTLRNLADKTTYEVTVSGTNDLGEGEMAIPSSATTLSLLPAKLPAYQLINTYVGEGQLTAHIVDVVRTSDGYGGNMVNSPFEADKSSMKAWGVADGDQASYYYNSDWDYGVTYHRGDWGLKFTFDGVQSLGGLALVEPQNGGISQISVFYWDETTGQRRSVDGARVSVRQDENNRRYLYVSFPQEVRTQQVMVGFSTGYSRGMSVSEVLFYGYDGIYQDIMALYSDPCHTTLHTNVSEAEIDALSTRLNTPDPVSGELHPDYKQLTRELETARKLLSGDILETVNVHAGLGASVKGRNDSALGFTGLNDWQPLGVVAAAGETVTIYVGHTSRRVGESAQLQLVYTQYNAESGKFVGQTSNLVVGENTIQIPTLVSKEFERGGSLYIRYTGNNANDQYAVRVAGGNPIPTLDLYGISDQAQALALTQTYVEELETYVAQLEQLHNTHHQGSNNANVNYDYNPEECILGATELMGDRMLFSLSAQQVLSGLGSGTAQEKAQRLLNSMEAMDQMMVVFYQHKGLTDDAPKAINKTPSQHLNIRYMRMFAGAFMYAAGNHIGVGWGSIPDLVTGSLVQADDLGRYLSGNWFGWGIGHEIGHDINQGAYAVAEVTNNYFAQLSTYENGYVRFGYDAVYDKVTSGTVGQSDDVFTQLAMYWQLRLAYDNYYPYKSFTSYQDVVDSLFFARVDTYARTPSAAPKAAEGGIALTLEGDANQKFMRLASAAAQRDLTEFFLAWGMEPNAATLAYMGQFEKEERAIAYVNDQAQDYRIQNPDGETFQGKTQLEQQDVQLTLGDDTNGLAQNQVQLAIRPDQASASLLGYEITRTVMAYGQPQTQVVGFVLAGDNGEATFVDTVTTINNRAFTYQVVAVDQYLYRAEPLTLETVKISHDGSHDKSFWDVTTNMTSEQDSQVDHDEENPDAGFNPGQHDHPTTQSAISLAFDNNQSTTYTGTTSQGDAMVEISFGQALDVTGLKLNLPTLPAGTLKVQLLEDGTWVDVNLEDKVLTAGASNTLYFVSESGWIRTSAATGLRLTFVGAQEVSLTEVDVLGPTGDNVEMASDGIGLLGEDYIYDQNLYTSSQGQDGFIPAGSLVYIGSYKGNPAYNAVIVYDQDGNMVGYTPEGEGKSEQIILAPVPDQGDLGNTSDGRWVYWVDPSATPLPTSVRVELYRVDDAMTNAGQRLVSDSLWVELPQELPTITITGQG
ncbi:fibronectin type III domain-containing protein [Pseudoflavonifractor sp. An85]|uniref:fibronectin type III domain-containing protein n=1 Tax=Pseudoflavonifractor sp. An85 TaxID=1965661 RepID=UPI000B385AAF|nr:fibronectin type III domain-containing protein [Pseudoflavonifractor sp. An85]OUN24614.1 hypothetical protein B5G37_06495 [Pseudoflavonifractor sp. An85]